MAHRLLAAAAAILLGCSAPAHAQSAAAAPSDPLQPFNRAMFDFNKAVVDHAIDPTVAAVGPYIPPQVVTGVHNAYRNLTEVEFILNGLLRLDAPMAGTALGRMAINTTLGIGGLFDVATYFGLRRQTGDFGEALCATGLPPGPYLVLPLIGPTNAVSAPVLAGGVAIEVYLLSFISTTLAMADFLVIDLGGSAAALQYMTDIPPGADGYVIQRDEYDRYIKAGCGTEALARS